MEVSSVAKALGIRAPAVLAKATELQRKSNMLLSGKLGQGECCKAGICIELACLEIGHSVQRKDIVRACCTSDKIYSNTFSVLQQALGVKPKASLKELLIQYGCVRLEPAIKRVLNTYKERFLEQLKDGDRRVADFTRPVFLAAAFCLVARKNKVSVNKAALISTLGVMPTDYTPTAASMYDLCFDIVGVEKRKRQRPDDTAAHDRAAVDDQDLSDIPSSDEGDQDRHSLGSRQPTSEDFRSWVTQVTDKPKGAPVPKKLRQVQICFTHQQGSTVAADDL